MASYRSIVLPPPDTFARAYHLATVHRAGAVVWLRDDGVTVEPRETWPEPPEGPDPATLTETPADPEAAGWEELGVS